MIKISYVEYTRKTREYELGKLETIEKVIKTINKVIDDNTAGSDKFVDCSPDELKSIIKNKLKTLK